MTDIPHLNGLSEMAADFDAFMLDIFGLLHNGVTLYPGTLHALERLQAMGKPVCLVSNTPRLPPEVASDLRGYGLRDDFYVGICTAGLAAQNDLIQNHRGRKIWFTGKDKFLSFLDGSDVVRVDDPAQADLLVNALSGMTEQNDGEIYAALTLALEHGKPMLCANPDMVVHIGDDIFKCAGTYARWYEDHGGSVTYHGKPHPSVYEIAFEKLGSPARVYAMGDALHTDIQGANRMGFSSIWVLCGIHREELRLTGLSDPPDLDRVAETIKMSPYKPTATLTHFCW